MKDKKESNIDKKRDFLKSDRREFIKLCSAGLAATGLLSSCKNTVIRNILPYPANSYRELPGNIKWIASSCNQCHAHCPILVKTYENRPVLIESNPMDEFPNGIICKKGISALFELYSDKRAEKTLINGKQAEIADAREHLKSLISQQQQENKPFYLITSAVYSPSLNSLINGIKNKYPCIRHVVYDLSVNQAVRNLFKEYVTPNALPVYHFEKTKIIISVEDDFLSHPEYVDAYFRTRQVSTIEEMSYHLQIESRPTPTGAVADQHLLLSPDEQLKFLKNLSSSLSKLLSGHSNQFQNEETYDSLIPLLAKKLLEYKGRSIIVSGSHNYENQQLVAYINQLLGNFNRTISFIAADEITLQGDLSFPSFLKEISFVDKPLIFAAECHDSVFEFLKQDSKLIRLGIFPHPRKKSFEISFAGKLFPERWEDFWHPQGFISFSQPVAEPYPRQIQLQEILLYLLDYQGEYYDYLHDFYLNKNFLSSQENNRLTWEKVLHDGYLRIPRNILKEHQFDRLLPDFKMIEKKENSSGTIQIFLNHVKDSTAYNPLLSDFANPMTGVLNQAVVSISEQIAKTKNLTDGDVVDIINGKNIITATVSIIPEIPDHVWQMEAEFTEEYGCQVFKLLKFEDYQISNEITDFSIRKTGEWQKLFKNQTILMTKSKPVPEYTWEEYTALTRDEESLKRDFTRKQKYTPQWALVIDLNKCTGCANCVAGCMTENNIPFVGHEEISKNRSLNWIRIEKIIRKEGKEKTISFLPVMCQQCETAPCERVCPVGASSHSQEGLNQQNYERCIGARFCNNNCPYLARTFNYLNYASKAYQNNNKYRMLLNPEVSVREKGVSEKCTFCIQRIQEAKRKAKINNELITDGTIKTACERACTSGAITFGNLADPASFVYRSSLSKRAFYLLEDKGTKPKVIYLARVRNSQFIKSRNNEG